MLIVLVSWLAIIFMSAGLFAPANATVIIALMLAALSVSGAIFLILELDTPFDGVIQISKKPMYNALAHLGHYLMRSRNEKRRIGPRSNSDSRPNVRLFCTDGSAQIHSKTFSP
jgi:hypothetical protein